MAPQGSTAIGSKAEVGLRACVRLSPGADIDPLDLKVYVDAFRESGFRGPINRYRAQTLDFADLAELSGKTIVQPSCFIAGERDLVRSFVPGTDLYAAPGAACADFRGATILPGIGHWVQQEAPSETNAALENILRGL